MAEHRTAGAGLPWSPAQELDVHPSESRATLRGVANTELILGLAGIGGTLIASTTGLGSTLWLERRRQAREDRQERHKLRTAARLVMDELSRNRASVGQALPASDGIVRTLFPFEQSNWTQYAPVLATIDDREAWMAITFAYTAFATVVANDGKFVDAFGHTLSRQSADAIEALRPHV